MQPSRRVRETSESAISAVAHLAGPGVASMAQGCVYWPPPPAALATAAAAIAAPEMHSYGAVLGRDALKTLIKKKLHIRNRIEGKEVMITPGGNEAWTAVLMALVDPGDEAIIFEPYYFNAKMALELLNVRPVVAKCNADLTPNISVLPFSERTRLVILVNPSNPTGYVWPQASVMELQRKCAERKIWLVSDEAYEDFLWDGAKHYSPVGDNVINLYTMSKCYGMHGWRIGYCAYPPSLCSVMLKIQDTLIINTCQFSQGLAIECMRSHADYPSEQVATLVANRSTVWDVVGAYEGTVKTAGAFYFFVKLPVAVGAHTDVEVCEYLAKQHKVLVTAGESFGRKSYIRVSYGNAPHQQCKENAQRLKEGLAALARGALQEST